MGLGCHEMPDERIASEMDDLVRWIIGQMEWAMERKRRPLVMTVEETLPDRKAEIRD